MINQKKYETDIRFAVWKILFGVLEEHQYSHTGLQRLFREQPQIIARDRAFAERMVRGTLEHLYELDALIESCSRLPVRKLKPHIRTVLRMSVYQLRYMDSVPARAVCSEAVKLTNRLGFGSLKNYVNGVLRNLARSLEGGFSVISSEKDPFRQLSLRYSMPEWILKRYVRMFGETAAEELLQAQMEPVKLSVYRNPLSGSREALKQELALAGAVCEELPFGLDGFYITSDKSPDQLQPFCDGAFLIQDVSSMLQGKIASAQKGQYIVDVCAAPGGKALHAAMDMKGTGCVDCADISEAKTALIRENTERLKLTNVKISVRDALVFDAALEEKADILIADLPCSGLGIIGRKPEIRYNVSEKDVENLAALQRRILDTVWRYVKPGGRLIYSTCTLTEEEDEENYRYLTEQLPFSPESLKPYLPDGPHVQTLDRGYLKLIPGIHSCDGFFIGSAVRSLCGAKGE